MADKVFMYGPLMGGYELAGELQNYQFLKPIGRGKTPGRLYDLGGYPGAVELAGPDQYVYGDLYECNNNDTMNMIDEAAGAVGDDPDLYAFRRRMVVVTLANGTVDQAWIFFYTQPVDAFPEIPSGSFRAQKAEEKKLSRRGFFTRLFPKTD